jgi:hypothetical protein
VHRCTCGHRSTFQPLCQVRRPGAYKQPYKHSNAGLVTKASVISSGPCAQKLKYGVVSTADAQHDLQTWQHLYLAGRMHKPIDTLSDSAACKCTQKAILFNRVAAVTAAVLLQTNKCFGAHQLLRTIVGLSYTGAYSIVALVNLVACKSKHYARAETLSGKGPSNVKEHVGFLRTVMVPEYYRKCHQFDTCSSG